MSATGQELNTNHEFCRAGAGVVAPPRYVPQPWWLSGHPGAWTPRLLGIVGDQTSTSRNFFGPVMPERVASSTEHTRTTSPFSPVRFGRRADLTVLGQCLQLNVDLGA